MKSFIRMTVGMARRFRQLMTPRHKLNHAGNVTNLHWFGGRLGLTEAYIDIIGRENGDPTDNHPDIDSF